MVLALLEHESGCDLYRDLEAKRAQQREDSGS